MTAWLIVAFGSGVTTHKLWRVGWRVHRHPLRWRQALVDEFAPPDHDQRDTAKARPPRVTEQA